MTQEEKNVAMKTSRSSGASALNKDGTIRAVVPLFVEKNIDKSKNILDFGAGKGAVSAKYLCNKGFNITAYDFWVENNGDKLLNKNALKRKYDVVYASNVINVQSSIEMLIETLNQIYSVVVDNGECIMNYPSSPRKLSLNSNDIKAVIEKVFNSQVECVGGTNSAPIFRIVKNINYT